MNPITEKHLEHWRSHGYVIVEHLLDDDELEAARENIARYLPTWEEYRETPDRYRALMATSGGWPVQPFPFAGDALNDICTHPTLVSLARSLLRTDDIALSHSRLRGLYAGVGNHEQELHVDYAGNTLAYPKDDSEIFDLPCIIYYTDVTAELGPTYVVSQQYTRDEMLEPHHRSIEEFPELYAREVPVEAPAGSALFYSMRTFHRGSAIRAGEGVRFSHHMSWRNGAYRWSGQVTFQYGVSKPEMNHFMTRATPEQRELVGFPPVGHPYWDSKTLAGVADRYPGMDMTPYKEALAGR